MRKFLVNVNGTSYEVMVEEIGGGAQRSIPARSSAARTPVRPPVTRPAAAPRAAAPAAPSAPAAPAAPAASSGAGQTVPSPMPGNIVDVKVKVGDAVNAGDVLMILEAMKMENEILAPCAGTVKELKAAKGSSLSTGEALAVIG